MLLELLVLPELLVLLVLMKSVVASNSIDSIVVLMNGMRRNIKFPDNTKGVQAPGRWETELEFKLILTNWKGGKSKKLYARWVFRTNQHFIFYYVSETKLVTLRFGLI